MRVFLQDWRYALRIFGRDPGSVTLTLVLALGIGATTAMFTVLYGVILQPLPFKNPHRLVVIGAPAPPTGDSLAWWGQSHDLVNLCSYRSGGLNLTGANLSLRVPAAIVSTDFFAVFGVRPRLGRPFVADDETRSDHRIAIISDRLWAQNLGRDPGVIEKSITLNGVVYSIVGVMDPDFVYPGHTDIWVPRTPKGTTLDLGGDNQADLPSPLSNTMIGRLRTDVSLTEAHANLRALFERLQETYAQSQVHFGSGVQMTLLQDALVGTSRPSLWLLFAGVGCLLLIACTNAVNLMLASAATRQKEIAVRLCLGANPLRVMRQFVTEAVFLSLVSGTAGVFLAYWGVEIIRALGPSDMPRLMEIRFDAVIFAFALCLSVLVGVVVGAAPGLQAFSTNLVNALKKEGSRTSGGFRRRMRNIAVTAEIALALVLVVGAGLAIKSFFRVTNVAPGFEPKKVVTMSITLPAAKYGQPQRTPDIQQKHEQIAAGRRSENGILAKTLPSEVTNKRTYLAADFHQRLLASIESLPGIVAASCITQLPLNGASARKLWVGIPGTQGGLALFFSVSANYFRAMGIPVLNGRSFTKDDIENAPKVVLINETLARLFWGETNPIGQSLQVADESVAREIVGVVGDVKYTGLSRGTEPQFYLPYPQPLAGRQLPLDMILVVRASDDAKTLVSTLREQVASIDEYLPVFRERTMEEVLSESTSVYRFRGVLLGSLALLALGLAVAGVYAVVAHSVASRKREIGIRMSLGAQPQDILLMILREGVLLAFTGVIIGTAAALALNRFISSLLYGISPTDIVTLTWSAFTLIAAALIACLIPALRSSRIEPATVLRYE
jgi:putative ABC transport system permease protein